jgi:hypothetical protein
VKATNLCGDVEDRWDIEAEPTMAFDYPTIPEIADYIWNEINARG